MGHAWDWSGAGVKLERRHVASVLARFLDGRLSAATLEAWADAVEGRDDVDASDAVAAQAVFALANPALEGPLTAERARALLARLDA